MSTLASPTSGFATSSSFPTAGSGNGLPPISSSAALYLYTFLATLILLLSVSGIIVGRSYYIRRQQRLLIEEAIRNGTYVPPPPPSSRRRRDFGEKPVLYDVYVPEEPGSCAGLWKEDPSTWWMNVKPLAAVTEKSVICPALSTPSQPLPPPPQRPAILAWLSHAPTILRRNRATAADASILPTTHSPSVLPFTSTSTPSTPAPPYSSLSEKQETSPIQTTILIAMPSPSSRSSRKKLSDAASSGSGSSSSSLNSREEEGIPYVVELGIAKVAIRDDEYTKSPLS